MEYRPQRCELGSGFWGNIMSALLQEVAWNAEMAPCVGAPDAERWWPAMVRLERNKCNKMSAGMRPWSTILDICM